jgi:hypothetical protein
MNRPIQTSTLALVLIAWFAALGALACLVGY